MNPIGFFFVSETGALDVTRNYAGFAQCPVSARKRRRIVYVPPDRTIIPVLCANIEVLPPVCGVFVSRLAKKYHKPFSARLCFYFGVRRPYCSRMSILDDYIKHMKLLGEEAILAIDNYIEEMSKNGYETSYSHVIYNEKEFEKFKK